MPVFLITAFLSSTSISQQRDFTNLPAWGITIFENPVQFEKPAQFDSTTFKSTVKFDGARFGSGATFDYAQFDSLADFKFAKFQSRTTFVGAQFKSRADFYRARYDSVASFRGAKFDGVAVFIFAEFDSHADFRATQFHSITDFWYSKFRNTADFTFSKFDSTTDFWRAKFDGFVNFKNAKFNNKAIALFSQTTCRESILIGGADTFQRFDFKRAVLDSNDKIILFGPVDLKIQQEKFKFLELSESLDYYTKKDIISTLKDSSFTDINDSRKYGKERFELDYMFEKSTMYQVKSDKYKVLKKYQPQYWINTLYEITLGLGYRPFRLVYWILGLVILYSVIYVLKIPKEVKEFIWADAGRKKTHKEKTGSLASLFEKYINCLYFSVTVFLTFRLNKDILTFFSPKHKRLILTEWLIGLLIYAAFITLSKQGSILNTLKSLVFG